MTVKKGYGPLCELFFERSIHESQQELDQQIRDAAKEVLGPILGPVLTDNPVTTFLADAANALQRDYSRIAIQNTHLTEEEYNKSEAACAVQLRSMPPVLGL